MQQLIVQTGLEFTPHGVKITRRLTLEEWKGVLRGLRSVKMAYHGILADLTLYGRENYGDEVVAETIDQLEFEWSDASRAAAISQIPHDFREEYDLNSEQAYELSRIEDEAERRKWAKACQEHSLSAINLKRSIEFGRVLTPEEIAQLTGQGSGVSTIQGVRFQFERWTRQMKGTPEVLKMKPGERTEILKVLEPIIELAAELQESLTT